LKVGLKTSRILFHKKVIFLVFLLFASLLLWEIGNQTILSKKQVYISRSHEWGRTGEYRFIYEDFWLLDGRIRVGEKAIVAKLDIIVNLDREVFERVDLTTRLYASQTSDYPNRSKAIIIEHSSIFNGGYTSKFELAVVFNETMRFGNETVEVTQGHELSLNSFWWFDKTLYYRDGSVEFVPRASGGGRYNLTVYNPQYPLLTFFLEEYAVKLGQIGTAAVLITAAIFLIRKRFTSNRS
jgi:hypothetical protein